MNQANLPPDFEELLTYLKQSRRFDFSGYKRPSLLRRIQKRMQMVNIEDYSTYIDYLEVHPEEFTCLFNTILINVTHFFRDAAAWKYLQTEVVPQLIQTRAYTSEPPPIRVWSAGCASGQETYTLAMVLAEALGTDAFRDRVKIFATDVDEEALNQARLATYSSKEVADIPPELLTKYFEYSAHHYIFRKDLRRSVIFGRHDLVQDAPISRIDLLVCRNTLMYFNSETQTKILDRFHFALNDDKFLLLGKAEMLFARNSNFAPVDLKQRLFTKVSNTKATLREQILLAGSLDSGKDEPSMSSYNQIQEAAFAADPVAQIVVDLNGILIAANERSQRLFGLTPKDINRPLQDLEISYRPIELRSRIEQVAAELRPILLKDIGWQPKIKEAMQLDIHLIPLLDLHHQLLATKIVFTDVTRYNDLQQELQNSNQELETAYEELQSTNEELETTNEELQSTVEELETTNEELQSTNEELETMNEELQSTNEELQAINEELRQRSDELNHVNGFLESILVSLRMGVVVVNRDLVIQIWNHRAEDLWGLRAEEVRGQHFLNLDIGLPVSQLRSPMRACLIDVAETTEIVLEALNRRGKSIQCKICCSPLITSTKVVQGVILLMEEQEIISG